MVHVAVELLDGPPRSVADDWTEVSEVSLAAGPSPVWLVGGDFLEGHLLSEQEAEARVRVHARGRTRNPDGVDSEPFEEYLVKLWPAPHAAPRIIREPS